MQQSDSYFSKLGELEWEISNFDRYFHASCSMVHGRFGGSGFYSDEVTARKIARVELAERTLAANLLKENEEIKLWGLNFDNSGSGFAAGYVESKTVLRALSEACERWALSQWIDRKYALSACPVRDADVFTHKIQNMFDECSQFFVEVPLLIDDVIFKFKVAVVLGWLEQGVFVGYGSNLDLTNAFRHAYVEAYRNLVIFKNQKFRTAYPYNRIWYFATNVVQAKDAIEKTQEKVWPVPNLKLLKVQRFNELWLARAILDDWLPWQYGPITRFLY